MGESMKFYESARGIKIGYSPEDKRIVVNGQVIYLTDSDFISLAYDILENLSYIERPHKHELEVGDIFKYANPKHKYLDGYYKVKGVKREHFDGKIIYNYEIVDENGERSLVTFNALGVDMYATKVTWGE